MNEKLKIFVIVVTYKGKQWYDKCFGSLRESEIPVQVVAVDNSPGEEDAEYIKTHFPEIHLIKTNENLGFGRANNIGMRYALDNGCDYVFLLNQDAWLDSSDTLIQLVTIAEKHPEYGILSPMHINVEKNELVMECFCKQPTNKSLIEDLYFRQLKDVYETEYIHAAAWMLSGKTLEIVGGFDPIFFQYAEDDNYLKRVLYHGFKVGVCPAASIVHDHHTSELSDERLLLRQRQALLVEWTDINKPFSVWRQYRYYLRKWLSYILLGKFKKAKAQRETMQYCRKMKKAVEFSQIESRKSQASWL